MHSLWKRFVRPERLYYSDFDLGPDFFTIGDVVVQKFELEIPNQQGKILKASFFDLQTENSQSTQQFKTMIYCHGFNACRVEALKYAQNAAKQGMSFCCFDFQGAGNSQGEYITLGYTLLINLVARILEQEDILSVINYLKKHLKRQMFVLWGRSLGATTILFHQLKYQQENSVIGIILDSAFNDFKKVANKMVRKAIKVPKFVANGVLLLIEHQIQKNTKLDIAKIRLPQGNLQVYVPALFVYSEQDTLIKPKNSLKLFKIYKGDKQIIKVQGDHNEIREQSTLDQFCQWAKQLERHEYHIVKKVIQMPQAEKYKFNQNRSYSDVNITKEDKKQKRETIKKKIFETTNNDRVLRKNATEIFEIKEKENVYEKRMGESKNPARKLKETITNELRQSVTVSKESFIQSEFDIFERKRISQL